MKKTILITGILIGIFIFAGLLIKNRDKQSQSTVSSNSVATETATPDQKVDLETGVQKGQLAPDFKFTTIDGENKKLSDFKGKPVVFGFILTTGCTPCAEEARVLKQVQDKNAINVIQIVVSSIEPKRNIENFKQYLGGPDWLMTYDNGEELTKMYKVRAVDTTIMIDKDGKIIYRDDGYPARADELEAALRTT
ncbi:hypothetical protein CYG49_01475 [Candidatus Saccharibacteria bacterium]|nr:MAG: hypothetical protein CYG49_01475 [Candidatus Saccharibacteria bacterium]